MICLDVMPERRTNGSFNSKLPKVLPTSVIGSQQLVTPAPQERSCYLAECGILAYAYNGTPSSIQVNSFESSISSFRAINSSTSQLAHTNLLFRNAASSEASHTQK